MSNRDLFDAVFDFTDTNWDMLLHREYIRESWECDYLKERLKARLRFWLSEE